MDDDHFDDAAFTAAALAIESSSHQPSTSAPRITQPIPTTAVPKITQPTPQSPPARHAPTSILVSPRQKGNPILKSLTSLPWEYADIPADYTLGATTCCLFLSLKYHRLHPEYIYSRIKALAKNYNLRVLLTMVDVGNHEESLKELSKTSLINNLTLILCWSAREAARYLELYKQYEHAAPSAIRKMEGTGYAEKMVEFVTTVRSVNKADAVGLVSAFGSVRGAVNAGPEEVAGVSGWGEKKVVRWCGTVREGFRVRRAGRRGVEGAAREGAGPVRQGAGPVTGERSGLARSETEEGSRLGGLGREDSLLDDSDDNSMRLDAARAAIGAPIPIGRIPPREASGLGQVRATATPDAERRLPKRAAEDVMEWEPGDDEEEAFLLAAAGAEGIPAQPSPATGATGKTQEATKKARPPEPEMSKGVAAALAKLRQS
ncbi:ssDNA endonuclease and repair protein rad10 [Trapelia coarctata]|nr:ssDNA endonuclease and repair protein rad10 [Trapelia coarctata]